jgi:Mrp family chromosome partitioning ATPase
MSVGMGAVQVIAVTSGKSGAGKTSVSVNLALALAELGRRVVLLDADLAMGNVDIALGLIAERTLADVIGGQCAVSDVILQHPSGVRVVPAASGQPHMCQLSARQHVEIIHAVSELGDSLDYLIIDTAGGLSQTSLDFVRAAREVLIVRTGRGDSGLCADQAAQLRIRHGAVSGAGQHGPQCLRGADGFQEAGAICRQFPRRFPALPGHRAVRWRRAQVSAAAACGL